jgi:AcrR family transcriptional regulator
MARATIPDPAAKPAGRRERNRRLRYRRYLDAGMHIATTDGVKGLTMQRLAADLGCAVGTMYTYFPSKGALIAELQREAVERLAASYRLIRLRSDAELATWDDERAASIARLVVFGRFWIATVETFPEEAKLLHLLISEPEVLVPPEEQHRVVPVAMALLGEAQTCVEHAASVGGIQVSDSLAVVIRWAAALTGALQISNLAQLDPVTFDGPRLARELLDDLLRGWTVDPDLVALADEHADGLAASGPLAPPIDVDGISDDGASDAPVEARAQP